MLTSQQLGLMGCVGGQWSFNESESTCGSALIVTTNETWYGRASDLSQWRRGRSAPFEARRSMQADDSFVTSDSADGSTANMTRYELLHADKSASLAGGLRYESSRWMQRRERRF